MPNHKPELLRVNEVKSLTHRGVVTASAFLLDFDVLSLEVARQRILSTWRPGIRVYAVESALVVVLPQPLEVYCGCAIGLALVSCRSGSGAPLTAMPLSQKQLDKVNAPPRSIIWFKNGILTVEVLDKEEDVSTWIRVVGMQEVLLISPAVPTQDAEPVLVDMEFDPRRKLASGSPKAEGMDEFLKSLTKKRENSSSERGAAGAPNSVRPSGDSAGDVNLDLWLKDVLGKIFKTGESDSSSSSSSGTKPSEPSWLGNVLGSLFKHEGQADKSEGTAPPPDWPEHMKMEVYRLLQNTGLIGFIFERQKEYMFKMIDLFERGDWSEALKYGVPLGSETGDSSVEPYLDIPSARANLKINPNAKSSPSALIYSNPELYERMKKLYRNAVDQLTEAGRYEEAAFVLAELLGESEEAVSYLESQGRLLLAAELAEARKLPPGLIVRQWFLAGDIERAVNIARVNNCFQTAVRLLEKDHYEEAKSLRVIWARHLADVGNYAAATSVAQNIVELEDEALEWTKLALKLRDKNSGRLLAYWLTSFKAKDDWPSIKESAVKLLDDESRELAPARMSFNAELKQPFSKEVALLKRKAGRALLRDHGRQYISLSAGSFVNSLEDDVLQTDVLLCDLSVERQELKKNAAPIELSISANDMGADNIYDAALLPDGRTVLALGEGGVCVLDADGIRLEHFALPATQFVMSLNGDRLLALAKRGTMQRITRLDLVSSRFEDLGEARLSSFATSYSGSTWFAARGWEFFVVDAAESRFKILWQTTAHHEIASIVSHDGNCSVSTCLPEFEIGSGIALSRDLYPNEVRRGMRIWQYMSGMLVPSRDMKSLVGRRNLEQQQALSTPSGHEVFVGPYSEFEGDVLVVRHEGQEAILSHHWTRIDSVSTAVSDEWIALTFTQTFPETADELQFFSVPVSSMCYLLDASTLKVHAKISFGGARRLTPRIQYDVLNLCDDSGRFVALDLISGAVLRSHTI